MDYPPSPILSSKQKSNRFINCRKKFDGRKSQLSNEIPDTDLLEDGNDTRISDLVNTIITGTKTFYNSTPQQIETDNDDVPSYSPIKKLSSRKLKPIKLSEDSLKVASKLFDDIFEHSEEVYNLSTPHRKYSDFHAKKNINFDNSTLNDSNDYFSNDISDTQMIQIVDEITATAENSYDINVIPKIEQFTPEKDFNGFTDNFLTVSNRTKDRFVKNFQQWTTESQILTFKDPFEDFKGFDNNCLRHNCIEILTNKIQNLENALKKNSNIFLADEKPKSCLKRTAEQFSYSQNTKKFKEAYDSNECFRTASNKNIKLDSNLIKRAAYLFEDMDESQVNILEPNTSKQFSDNKENVLGFKTASNKQIQIEEETLKNVQGIFENLDEDKFDLPNKILADKNKNKQNSSSIATTGNFGFFTASNKKVEISVKSLENARNFLNELPEENFIDDSKSSDHQIRTQDENMEKNRKIFENFEKTELNLTEQILKNQNPQNINMKKSNSLPTAIPNNLGFTTASNKKVEISAKYLEKARNLLKDCTTEEEETKSYSADPRVSLEKSNSSPATIGFLTASNKKVAISAKSLENARNLLHDCADEDLINQNAKKLESANNRSTLKRQIKITEETEFDSPNYKNSNSGFFTASNKNVQINTKSLENARNFLNELSDENFIDDSKSSGLQIKSQEETLEKSKNIFENFEKTELNLTEQNLRSQNSANINVKKLNSLPTAIPNNLGFSTASNKKVEINAKYLEKARNLLKDCTEEEETKSYSGDLRINLEKSNSSPATIGFLTASNRKVAISAKSLENARNLLHDCADEDIINQNVKKLESANNRSTLKQQIKITDGKEFDSSNHKNSNSGFFTASNKNVQINKKSLENARNLLNDCSEDLTINPIIKSDPNIELCEQINIENFHSDQNKCIPAKDALNNENVINTNNFAFCTASNKKIDLNGESLEYVRNLFNDCTDEDFMKQSQEVINEIKLQDLLDNEKITEKNLIVPNDFENQLSDFDLVKQNNCKIDHNTFLTASDKKVEVSTKSLDHVRNLFNDSSDEECLEENKEIDRIKLEKNIERQEIDLENETLINFEASQNNNFLAANVDQNSDFEIDEENNSKEETLIEDIDMYTDDISSSSDTDTNGNKARANQNTDEENNALPTSTITFQVPTAGNSNDWKCAIDQKCNSLRKQLEVMETRKSFLDLQIQKKNARTQQNIRFELGSLSRNKQQNSTNRKTLRDFVNNKHPISIMPPNLENQTLYYNLWNINPDNACNFHFYLPSPPHPPVIKLDDNGLLIPTTTHFVGITEFRAAFEVLSGVDSKCIPNGWFNNHFRWIVWKLACMDRQFPGLFDGYFLTPKNVMCQLKYRYDRDVYNNQRSALRIITEKDDVSCRRMVLCVSKIIFLSTNEPEIELSDGWYSIKAVFDPLLLQCVRNGRISVGTKLVTYGAELLNCTEAAHPLQIPINVRLKLHGNSTRRVKWDTKLGFQKNHGPFLVSLHGIKSDGGAIGHIFVIISRVLPLKYLEKTSDNTWVCRCKRSETRQQRLWEKEQEKCLEKVQQEVIAKMEREWKVESENLRKNCDNIREIRCPQTLLYMLENSSDPGDISELMSDSQRQAVTSYRSKLQFRRQEEISAKIKTVLDHRGFKERTVHSVLQLILVDANKPNIQCTYILEIWNPDDSLIQILKEKIVLNIYNLTASNSRDCLLKSTKQTRYIRTSVKNALDSNLYGQCYFLSIEQILQKNIQHPLQFCDTIGVIVKLACDNSTSAAVWLADSDYRILRIQYIMDVNNCLAFQGYREGDIVAVFNIKILKRPFRQAQLQIDYVTIVTKEPSEPYIRNKLNILRKDMLLMSMKEFLEVCSDQIREQ